MFRHNYYAKEQVQTTFILMNKLRIAYFRF